jgi:tetratricopeptide (TPR) repeat protein
MTTAIGNVAGDRMDQGDLRGAIQLYEESLQDRDPADTGYAALVGLNIAAIHQLQGNLAGARQGFEQSLAIWQKNGDQGGSADAMSALGSVLLEEADFSNARKMYGQALALRTSAGEKLSIAGTQFGLAELSLEEGHSPVEQEAVIRQARDSGTTLTDKYYNRSETRHF